MSHLVNDIDLCLFDGSKKLVLSVQNLLYVLKGYSGQTNWNSPLGFKSNLAPYQVHRSFRGELQLTGVRLKEYSCQVPKPEEAE